MSACVQFNEIHLIVRVPADLEESACEAIQGILESRAFGLALGQTVRQVVRHYPDLDPIRVHISR